MIAYHGMDFYCEQQGRTLTLQAKFVEVFCPEEKKYILYCSHHGQLNHHFGLFSLCFPGFFPYVFSFLCSLEHVEGNMKNPQG